MRPLKVTERCRGLREDAERHTKKADNPKRQRMWAEIANSVLAETGDEGRAIREANVGQVSLFDP